MSNIRGVGVVVTAVSVAVVLLTALPLIRLFSISFILASQGFVPHHLSGGSPSPSVERATSNNDRR